MLSEILISTGCFILGGIVGSMFMANMLIKVNKLYYSETGQDFVSWVFSRSNKKRVDTIKADLEVYVEKQRKG